jgi:predicted DsbA family dithiol-disulfide isomerase
VRIERLRKEKGVALRWVHFPLHPETPAEGRSLAELFAGRNYDIEARQREMRERMAAEGLPYGNRTMTYNSRLAQELGKWAASLPDGQPGKEEIHDALFRAYFVDGKNIGDADVLVDIAKQAGLDEAQAREVVEKRTFKAAVDQDWAKSRGYGITGVPTFVAGGYGLVGAQPYEALAQFVEQVRASQARPER